jgi:hypothetical protein
MLRRRLAATGQDWPVIAARKTPTVHIIMRRIGRLEMRRLTRIRPDRFGPKAVNVGSFSPGGCETGRMRAIVEQIHAGPERPFVPISAQQHLRSRGDPAMPRFPGL